MDVSKKSIVIARKYEDQFSLFLSYLGKVDYYFYLILKNMDYKFARVAKINSAKNKRKYWKLELLI